jgi:putative acetyltransferase
VIEIRPERDGDEVGIRDVIVSAFGGEDEANLVDALRASDHLAVSLVAIADGRIVGHIAFSPVTIDGRPGGLGLAPLAVRPEHQRSGIGSRLMIDGMEAASDADYVVVLGHPTYYAKFGFRRAGEYGIGNEYGADDAFLVRELRTGSIPTNGGLARYGPEFGAWS